MQTSLGFLTQAYGPLATAVGEVDEAGSWRATGCLGWSVRDLTVHCWSDAQRALVALHTPTDAVPDVDAVTYWQGWGEGDPDGTGAANGRRFNRVVGSLFLDWSQLRREYLDTAAAVVHAAAASQPRTVVATQGHALTVDDLLATLAVEATIHHLDLLPGDSAAVPGGEPGPTRPTPDCLASTRHVLDRLAQAVSGPSLPATWADERCIRLATGRAEPTAAETAELEAAPGILPLFR